MSGSHVGVDIFFGVFFGLILLGIIGASIAGTIAATTEWRHARALVKLARTYGIEYVPGENLDALRARVVARRDAYLTPDKQ